MPIATRLGENHKPRNLAFNEDPGLKQFVVLAGIVVGILKAKISLMVMNAVRHYNIAAFFIHTKQFRSVIDTCVAIALVISVDKTFNLVFRDFLQ